MKSVLIFTVHKAGSMFVHRLTDYLTHQLHMPYYSPNNGNFPDMPVLVGDSSYFNGKSGCFGPLRQYCPVEHIENYEVILHLRDPRDMLVSRFFMVTHKNPGPKRWLRNAMRAYPYRSVWATSPKELFHIGVLQMKRLSHLGRYKRMRQRAASLADGGIDSYVMSEAEEYYSRYAAYCEKLVGKKNVALLRYEDMVTDFDRWYSEFTKPFGPGAETAIGGSMMETLRSQFQMKGEDRASHKRRVTPGDHRDKLRPETIQVLNEKFSDVLKALNYPV